MILRPLTVADEAVCLGAHRVMAAEGFNFLIAYDGRDWAAFVEQCVRWRHGLDLTPSMVPATFLVAEVDGAIVGRASIRHELNDDLLAFNGHIGYGVLPDHRRRGYATEILRQSLIIVRSYGVGDVLVTCDDDNDGSARTIENCGGELENVVDTGPGAPPKRRYWIRVS